MMLPRAVALLILVAAPLATIAADGDAAAYVRTLYEIKDNPGKDARFTPRLEALRAECEKKAEAEEDICIDYDMFVQGQDFELTDLNVEEVSGSADKATVKATFKNFGEAKEVTLDLIRDDKGWVIDEMMSGCQSLANLYRHDYCD